MFWLVCHYRQATFSDITLTGSLFVHMLLTLYESLSRLGIRDKMPFNLQKRVILSNKIGMGQAFLALILLFLQLWVLNLPLLTGLFAAVFSLSCSILILNKYHCSNLSRTCLCLIFPLAVLLSSMLLFKATSLETTTYFACQLSMLCSTVLPFIFFDNRQKRHIFFGVGTVTACLLASYPLHILTGAAPQQVGYYINHYFIIDSISLIWLLFLSGGFIFLQSINQRQIEALLTTISKVNKELTEKEQSLKGTSQQLQASNQAAYLQNLKIEYQNEYLTEMNKDLLKAKELIEEKNRQLERYSQSLEQHIEQRTLLLKKTNEELITANHELDTFVYRASHDLLGPVVSLQGLYNVVKLQEGERIFSDYLVHFGKTADKMHKKLLNLLEAMSVKEKLLEINTIDVKELIIDLFHDSSSMKNFDKINFGLHIAPSLTSLPTDKFLLKIIIKNLLTNAIEFSRVNNPGVETLESYINIEVISVDAATYCINIKDNGIGIADEAVGKIFEMFYKGNVQSKGAGLGLYIAQKAAGKLGGKISYIRNVADHESIFSITLPVLAETLETSPTTLVAEADVSAEYLPKAIHRLHPVKSSSASLKDKAYANKIFPL